MNKKIAAFKYDDVLPSHTHLDIWEVYACLVLQYIDSVSYGRLVYGDKPDWRDRAHDLGVEVTQALPARSQEADALYSKLHGEDSKIKRSRIVERIEQVGGKVVGGVLFGPNGIDSFDLVISAFKEKLKKLNGGEYEVFEHNHLFVRSNIHADRAMLEEGLADFVALNVHPYSFERVIVSVPGHNYDFDLVSYEHSDLPFGFVDQSTIAEKARSIVIEAEKNYAAE